MYNITNINCYIRVINQCFRDCCNLDYSEMQTKDKVRFYRTPDSILQRQLAAYDAAADKKAAENPLFKQIAQSQRDFAARAVKWDLDTNVSRRMAYNHYFARAAAKKS